ncbi:MAG: carboxypeptidase regulatory-like domain-containing protein [Longimicrobiales bacterium]|nr:carboxypeptidase regulatory-like domain-containing protein [Longimicrobiales bacterium]
MIRGRSFFFAALLLLVVPGVAAAQVLTGQVTDAGSGAPVPAVFVELLDADSMRVGAALTEVDGRYRIGLEGPGEFRLRLRRLGYAEVSFGPMAVTGAERFDVALETAPVRLEGVVATAGPVCADGPGVGPETIRLWELVTGALDVALLAQGEDRLRFDNHRFERDLTLDTHGILAERVARSREAGAFVAMPIETLDDQGYVEPDRGGGLLWYMPDPEVIVSDHFIETHCFRVVEGDDPEVVGIGFDPTPDRRDERPDEAGALYEALFDRRIVEVRGVLWIDRASGALREMEYSYVGLPGPEIGQLAGGRARFEQLRNGIWIVRQWLLHMPNLRRESGALRAESVREVGGYVIDVTALPDEAPDSTRGESVPESVLSAAPGGTVSGRIVPADLEIATEGVAVRLSGSHHEARTDSAGRFTFTDISPGTYRVTWWDPVIDALDLAFSSVEVTIEAGEEEIVEVPGPELAHAIDHLCRGMRVDPALGVVRVILRDSADRPVEDGMTVVLTSASGSLERETRTRDGVAIFCSVPTGVPLHISPDRDPDAGVALQLKPSELRPLLLRTR